MRALRVRLGFHLEILAKNLWIDARRFLQVLFHTAHGAFEFVHGFPEALAHFWELLRPEEDENDEHDNEEFRTTDVLE